MAADTHRIARVLCEEFLFFLFFSPRLRKKQGLSGCGKKVPPNSETFVSIRTVLICLSVCPSVHHITFNYSAENGLGPTDSVNKYWSFCGAKP